MADTNTIAITIELPQLARTFDVAVAPGATIRDVKDAIAQECEGRPRADGQRLIAKGRVLRDEEHVEDLWLDEDAHVLHLAVSPWAWSLGRPASPTPTTTSTATGTADSPANILADASRNNASSSTSSTSHTTNTPNTDNNANTTAPASGLNNDGLAARNLLNAGSQITDAERRWALNAMESADPPPYIMHLHYRALRALTPAVPTPLRPMSDSPQDKEMALHAVKRAGLAWHPVLDQVYPNPGPSGEGATYDVTMIGGLPHLENLTPYAKPTARQRHALEVLAYTFPLIAGTRSYAAELFHDNIRQRLRETRDALHEVLDRDRGAAVRVGLRDGDNPNGFHLQFRFPLRAFLGLMLLAFRVLLLMYFFSPARKPIFSLIVGVWVLYEAWGVVRGAFDEGDELERRMRRENLVQAGGPADVPPVPAPGAQGVAMGEGANAPAPADGRAQAQQQQQQRQNNLFAHHQAQTITPSYILNRLSRLNLTDEDGYLDPPTRTYPGPGPAPVPEPGVFFKARLFIALFVLTLHPAFWNKRRILLRMREAKVRAEAGAREVLQEVEREEETLRQTKEEEERRRSESEETEDGIQASRPLTTEERSLQAKRSAYQKMAEADARRPVWIRDYVERVVRESWVDQ